MRLANNPVGVATEGPAGDRADQGLLVTQTANQIGRQFWQVGDHSIHTALSNGPQNQDSRLFYFPVCMEQSLL